MTRRVEPYVKQSIYIDSATAIEVESESHRTARSANFLLQRAWKIARATIRSEPSDTSNDVARAPRWGRTPKIKPKAVPKVKPAIEPKAAPEVAPLPRKRYQPRITLGSPARVSQPTRVLFAMRTWFTAHEHAPTPADLSRISGIASLSVVRAVLASLRRSGDVTGERKALRLAPHHAPQRDVAHAANLPNLLARRAALAAELSVIDRLLATSRELPKTRAA